MLRCESGGVLSGLKARSLCDGGSITKRLRPPQSEVELQFCDDPQIAHALRCQNAADGCRIPLTSVVGSHAQQAPQRGMTRRILLIVATTAALFAWRIDGWAWRARRKRVGRIWDMNPLKFFAAIGIATAA